MGNLVGGRIFHWLLFRRSLLRARRPRSTFWVACNRIIGCGTGFCISRRMERDIVFVRKKKTLAILDCHTQCHEAVTIGLTIAEPCRDVACERPLEKSIPRKSWEGCQLAFLQLRYCTARKSKKDNSKNEVSRSNDGKIGL